MSKKLAVTDKPAAEIRDRMAIHARKAELDALYETSQKLAAEMKEQPSNYLMTKIVGLSILDTTQSARGKGLKNVFR